jgi:hypothetical protein
MGFDKENGLLVSLEEDDLRCKNLHAAILLQAKLDAIGPRNCSGSYRRRVKAEAKRWLAANDNKRSNSFNGICTIVGWDPEYIRCRIEESGPAT